MEPLSYLDLHEEFAPDIEAELTAALELLGPRGSAVRSAVAGVVDQRAFGHPLQVLPLLVHATETGAARPAVPVAAVHLLWWTGACHLDDVADGNAQAEPAGVAPDQAYLGAVTGGWLLPLRILQELPVSDALILELTREFVSASVWAADGQSSDLRGDTRSARTDAVLDCYRGKSGAPFAMVTAMAAQLAGAPAARVAQWREFGQVFGLLWQLFNDQEDITTGRHEDLANGTVTCLLACAAETRTAAARAELLELHDEARKPGPARDKVIDLLLDSATLERFAGVLEGCRATAHRLLGELAGVDAYREALHGLVDLAAGMHLDPATGYDARDGRDATGGATGGPAH